MYLWPSFLRECVMFKSAPVAFLWTRLSFERARSTKSRRASDFAIFALFSSSDMALMLKNYDPNANNCFDKLNSVPCVARLVMQPTALHWTSTFGLPIWRMRGSKPPNFTISNLLSATESGYYQTLPDESRIFTI